MEFLDEWGTENLDMVDIREIANPKTTKVFVNGNWVGVHRDPEDLIGKIRTSNVCVRACMYMYFFVGIFVYPTSQTFLPSFTQSNPSCPG